MADAMMGAMTLIKMRVVLLLGKYAVRALDDYTAKRKATVPITFRALDIGLPHTVDYWQE